MDYSTIIKANGWLENYLKIQKNGLTGHIAACGTPYDGKFWGDNNPSAHHTQYWWPYEQTGYFIDGNMRAAIASGDKKWMEEASEVIYNVILHPDKDGFLGPELLKDMKKDETRWPYVVFFRSCIALYEYNHDKRIIDAMVHHYLDYPVKYNQGRNVLNCEILLRLYDFTGEERLLSMAEKNYEEYNQFAKEHYQQTVLNCNGVPDYDWMASEIYLQNPRKKLFVHGVTYNEFAKLGAMFYKATGKKKYLETSIKSFEKIDNFYMLPGGCNSSSEYLTSNDYMETYETCDIADRFWSLSYLASITDRADYSDAMETLIYNAGIGSVTEDFRSLQYFSGANQLTLKQNTSMAHLKKGNQAMTFSTMPFTACCPGNVNRIMPNFVHCLWTNDEKGITSRLFGPSVLNAQIDGKNVSIEEKTNYPFDFSVQYCVRTSCPFVLRIRIPSWAKSFTVDTDYTKEGRYIMISVAKNMQIGVSFTADIVKKKSGDGVYFTYGPVVYSVGMKGKRTVYKETECDGLSFPSYEMEPDQDWNYAFVKDDKPVYHAGEDQTWNLSDKLPYLTIRAKKVLNWKIRGVHRYKSLGGFGPDGKWRNEQPFLRISKEGIPFTPRIPKGAKVYGETETIRLVPYGASKVRMTVLPETE